MRLIHQLSSISIMLLAWGGGADAVMAQPALAAPGSVVESAADNSALVNKAIGMLTLFAAIRQIDSIERVSQLLGHPATKVAPHIYNVEPMSPDWFDSATISIGLGDKTHIRFVANSICITEEQISSTWLALLGFPIDKSFKNRDIFQGWHVQTGQLHAPAGFVHLDYAPSSSRQIHYSLHSLNSNACGRGFSFTYLLDSKE
jgi:hypothetical protein